MYAFFWAYLLIRRNPSLLSNTIYFQKPSCSGHIIPSGQTWHQTGTVGTLKTTVVIFIFYSTSKSITYNIILFTKKGRHDNLPGCTAHKGDRLAEVESNKREEGGWISFYPSIKGDDIQINTLFIAFDSSLFVSYVYASEIVGAFGFPCLKPFEK